MGEKIFFSGNCVVDTMNQTIYRSGKTIRLSDMEFRLLVLLMNNINEPVSVKNIIRCLWGNEFNGNSEGVKVQIKKLRNRIEVEPKNPDIILSVRGRGYTIISKSIVNPYKG